MKKLLTLLLLLPALCFGQMTAKVGVYNGLCYKLWDNPNTNNLVIVLQGSGEFTQVTDCSDFYKFIDKNSYARNAKSYTYPFDILVAASYKPPGVTGNPSQAAIKSHLSGLVTSLGAGKKILTGYSFGAQCAAGFLTNSCNADRATQYLASGVFDGYVLMAGKAPGTKQWCVNDKPVLAMACTSDAAISYYNSLSIIRELASCPYRMSPETLVLVNGGSHGATWSKGYNIDDPYGRQVCDFIMSIFNMP